VSTCTDGAELTTKHSLCGKAFMCQLRRFKQGEFQARRTAVECDNDSVLIQLVIVPENSKNSGLKIVPHFR
jgi:hypothetical protein